MQPLALNMCAYPPFHLSQLKFIAASTGFCRLVLQHQCAIPCNEINFLTNRSPPLHTSFTRPEAIILSFFKVTASNPKVYPPITSS